MTERVVQRRLAAIVSADVVAYTRLMERDEVGTHARLRARFKALIEPKIGEHGGRVVKLMVDGLLAEFPSVVDAVNWAVEVQTKVAELSAAEPDDQRIEYRVGVNLGDVIVDGDDIYGDGVNVAARLQEIAERGGVCISEKVQTEVRGKLNVEFVDGGAQVVKNITDPIRVWRWSPGQAEASGAVAQTHAGEPLSLPDKPSIAVLPFENMSADPEQEPKPEGRVIGEARTAKKSWRWPAIATVAIALVAAASAVAWLRPWEPASIERVAHPLPDKPSIVVLPFINMSDDPAQAYFADGMTEDLITDLSKVSGLFVIARNSSFAYKGKQIDIRTVAQDLGVRYVLEGSVRRIGDSVRINAQLIEAATGGHMWADRYDGSLADIFALQDKVMENIVVALAVNLTSGEQSLQGRLRYDNPQAYDAFLQGREHFRGASASDYAKGVPYLEEAIKLDNGYGRAYAALAEIYRDSAAMGWDVRGVSPDEAFWRAEQYLHEALKDPSPLAHQVASKMLSRQGHYDASIDEAKRAIALDANDPAGYMAMADALIWAGIPTQSVNLINKAMRLDPHYPASYVLQSGLARFGLEQFDDAASALERAAKRNPSNYSVFTVLAASYGHLARKPQGQTAIDSANKWRRKTGRPPLTLAVVDLWPYKEDNDRERLEAGLRKVGVPEFPIDYATRINDRLDGDEIRSLMFGRTQTGLDPQTGIDWMVSIAPDGESMVLAPWFSGAETRWIDGDKLCSRYQGSSEAIKVCGFVFRNPEGTPEAKNQFEWVGGARIYPFSVE